MLSLSALWIMAFFGCRGTQSSHGPYREFEFAVDSTRLGESVHIGDIVFRVPKGWVPADSSVMEQVRKAAHKDTSRFPAEPKNVFIDLTTGSVLLCTTFPNRPEAALGFTGWGRQYVDTYRGARTGMEIQEEWLLLGGVHAVQIMLMDTQRVQFKFLIESEPVVGLDFSVPRPAWQGQARTVESSLGTIEKPK